MGPSLSPLTQPTSLPKRAATRGSQDQLTQWVQGLRARGPARSLQHTDCTDPMEDGKGKRKQHRLLTFITTPPTSKAWPAGAFAVLRLAAPPPSDSTW